MENETFVTTSHNGMVIEKLTKIFRMVFKDDTIILRDSTTAEEIGSWDSLSHMLMIEEVEKQFSVRFKLKEIVRLNNVGALVQLIESKLG